MQFIKGKLNTLNVSEKKAFGEVSILLILIFGWEIYFIPIYKSGFIFWNDLDLFKALCQQNISAILANKRIEPVFILLSTIVCKFNITQPAVFHYLNVALHVTTTILIFYFSHSLFSFFNNSISKLPSIICALVFCFHPINADTVFWIYSVKELSLTLFCLLSLISYLDFLKEPGKRNSYLLSLLFLIISCLSSRYCVQIILVYPVLSIILPQNKSLKTVIPDILPFLICLSSFCIYFFYDFYHYSIVLQNSNKDLSIYLASLILTINKLIFPSELSFYTPLGEGIEKLTTSNIIVFGFGGAIILIVFIIGFFRKDKLLILTSTFLITLVILSHLFAESDYLVHANSLRYLTTFGFTLFIGAIFSWLNTNRSSIYTYVFSGSFFIIIIAFSFSTFKRMKVWKNEITLWNNVLESYPKNSYAKEQKRQATKYHKNFILDIYGDERPNIKFTESSIDLGAITTDEIQSIEFEFENLGDTPVIINNVIASCGCTSTQWTNVPVLPNKKGKISANINPEGLYGFFAKSIIVLFNNCDDQFKLTIKGQIQK